MSLNIWCQMMNQTRQSIYRLRLYYSDFNAHSALKVLSECSLTGLEHKVTPRGGNLRTDSVTSWAPVGAKKRIVFMPQAVHGVVM